MHGREGENYDLGVWGAENVLSLEWLGRDTLNYLRMCYAFFGMYVIF